jgi:hypothetical protein
VMLLKATAMLDDDVQLVGRSVRLLPWKPCPARVG